MRSFPDNFRVPEVPCHAINLHGGLPLDDQSVDLAYSVEVLEHLEDQFLFFREVHRVLRPGGRFVLTTPNVLSLTSRVRTLLAGFPNCSGRCRSMATIRSTSAATSTRCRCTTSRTWPRRQVFA